MNVCVIPFHPEVKLELRVVMPVVNVVNTLLTPVHPVVTVVEI